MHNAASKSMSPVGVSIKVEREPVKAAEHRRRRNERLYTRMAIPGRCASSKFQLLILHERGFDPLAQVAELAAHLALELPLVVLRAQQFVDEVERDHDGDAVEPDNLATVAHFAHARVQVFGGIQECGA